MDNARVQTILETIHDWPVANAAGAVIARTDVATSFERNEGVATPGAGQDAGQAGQLAAQDQPGWEIIATTGNCERPFALASVSKPIAAYAALVAVEEGVCDLDSAVPASCIGDMTDAPTVRELLSHASGVAMSARESQQPREQRRIYSSAGYEILADALHYWSGIPFAEYADSAINGGLGTKFDLSGSPGHGFQGSVHDVAAFVGEVLAPQLLWHGTVASAATVQFPELAGIVPGYGRHTPCPWGLGFEIHGTKQPHWLDSSMPEHVIGHFGQSGTFMWMDRQRGVGAVVLTDEPFGDWAKPLWSEFNAELWAALNQ